MLSEGDCQFVFGKSQIVPYKGKYPVRDPNFFLKRGEDKAYSPLRIEIELTNQCNDTCRHCGMKARKNGAALSTGQIDHIIQHISHNKIPSIAITGGEPFLALEQLTYLVSGAHKNGIDTSKITSNAYWAESDCAAVIEPLIEAGILSNTVFIPTFMFSIGEQSVPLKYVANAFSYMSEKFDSNQISLALSSLRIPGGDDKKDEFIKIYETEHGAYPHERIHLTERVYNNFSSAASHKTVKEWLENCYDCFTPTVGAYVLPTALLKLNGDVFACACFNKFRQIRLGNIYEENLDVILQGANNRDFFKVIRSDGLKGFIAKLPKDVLERPCGDYCAACRHVARALYPDL